MPTDLEVRHRERDLLFRILRAQKFNDFDALIAEFTAAMEEEDVALVRRKIDNLKNATPKS
jgi:hypothetical protein